MSSTPSDPPAPSSSSPDTKSGPLPAPQLEAIRAGLKHRSPRASFRYRLEAFRFVVYIFVPVAALWVFNQPFIYDKAESFFMRQMEQMGESEEKWRRNSAQMDAFKEQFVADKRREEHAKLLREQMEFERARKYREKHGI